MAPKRWERHTGTPTAQLAGTAALTTGPRAAEAAPRPASNGGDLVIDGGTLLDPATGEVIEDGVAMIREGIVRAAGSRDRVQAPADAPHLDACR